MVSICESLQSYVPITSTEHTVEVSEEDEEFTLTADNFHHILGNKLDNSLSSVQFSIARQIYGDQLYMLQRVRYPGDDHYSEKSVIANG